jgi:hypothetical protein
LGPAGALSVALVPTVGADPTRTVYTVVYQLYDAVTNRQIIDEEKVKQIDRWHRGLFECLGVEENSAVSLEPRYPISSLQFSSVFLTSAMN